MIVMGALSQIAKSFDGSGDTLEAQKEVITTLSNLADSKLSFYKSQMENSYLTAGQVGNPTFPIVSMMKEWTKTHAMTESSSTELSGKLREAIGGFISGGGQGIADGIFKLLDAALVALFVDSVATEGVETQYFIFCKNNVISRMDMAAWYRNVTATAITKKMQKTSCFIVRQAVIDCKKTEWQSFYAAFMTSYENLNLTPEQIDAAEVEAEKLFVKNGGKIPPGFDRGAARQGFRLAEFDRAYKTLITTPTSFFPQWEG
jgi:hypothetical protein